MRHSAVAFGYLFVSTGLGAFIAFVNDLEEAFKVRFSNDNFQDKRFSTIDGLARLIEESMRKK